MAKKNPAAIFLILFAILAVVIGLSKVMLSVFDTQAMSMAFVPKHAIADDVMPPAPDYTKNEAWAALPDMESKATSSFSKLKHIALMQEADVFFLHPTTHMKPTQWNAAYDDPSALPMLENIALKNMASAFYWSGIVFAPRYRQATTGAFYDQTGQGEVAKARAYVDILAAYDNFISRRDTSRPYYLVGHSQGALHLLNLLKDRVVGGKESLYLIAAYIIGWPVSIEEDLDVIGMKACENESDTGCVLSWMSYAEGADTSDLKTWYDASLGLSGKPRAGSSMLCTNPLNWIIGGQADASLNDGSVVLTPGESLVAPNIANLTGANCKDGFLFVSPNLGDNWHIMDLGGGNLHFYDFNLYYESISLNAEHRIGMWREKTQ